MDVDRFLAGWMSLLVVIAMLVGTTTVGFVAGAMDEVANPGAHARVAATYQTTRATIERDAWAAKEIPAPRRARVVAFSDADPMGWLDTPVSEVPAAPQLNLW